MRRFAEAGVVGQPFFEFWGKFVEARGSFFEARGVTFGAPGSFFGARGVTFGGPVAFFAPPELTLAPHGVQSSKKSRITDPTWAPKVLRRLPGDKKQARRSKRSDVC